MRCISCNTWLTDLESTRKDATTGVYTDFCNRCIKGLDVPTIDRADLELPPIGAEDKKLTEDDLESWRGIDLMFDDEEYHWDDEEE